jgi:hypothetical protein
MVLHFLIAIVFSDFCQSEISHQVEPRFELRMKACKAFFLLFQTSAILYLAFFSRDLSLILSTLPRS